MTYDAIVKDIKSKKFAPVYLLHGQEPYFIDKISHLIETTAIDEGMRAFNQEVLYGKEVDFKAVLDSARQYPMMSSHRVIIIKEAQEMRSLKKLDTYAKNPSPTTILVLCHKHKKFDSRTKLAVAIKKNGVLFESKKLYDNKIPQWITSYLRDKEISIAPDAALLSAEFLGSDLSKISNELDKLSINLSRGDSIDVKMVTELIGISKDYNVFELQKALTQGNSTKVFRIVDYFSGNEKAHPLPQVLGSLYTYFYKIYIAAYHQKKGDRELQSLLGLPTPYFVREYREAAKRYSGTRLIDIFESLKIADLRSKGVDARNMISREILRDLMINILYGKA